MRQILKKFTQVKRLHRCQEQEQKFLVLRETERETEKNYVGNNMAQLIRLKLKIKGSKQSKILLFPLKISSALE